VFAIDEKVTKIAAGSRNGRIYIHEFPHEINNTILPFKFKNILIQGSPVLSICWLDNDFLAVSDKSGQCFIWDIKKKSFFASLETRGNIICGLFYQNNILFGLSMDSRLQLWDIATQKQLMNFIIPPLPRIGALVKSIYWPANNTLVFPGTEGRLSFYNIKDKTISTIKAHEGDFYSITLYGDYITSFGMTDHLCKIWCKGHDNPVLTYRTDKMIISSVCFSGHQDKFFLIDSEGTAYEYTLEQDGFNFVHQLPGQNYRVCISICLGVDHQFTDNVKRNKAYTIAKNIMKDNGQISDNEYNRYYEELTNIGFNHVRLALQADQAEKNGDLFNAIKFNIEILRIIPKDCNETCITMEKYATLLEKAWNFTEACCISKKILKINSLNQCAKKIINTYHFSGIDQDSWVIKPDISLDIVFKSATVAKNICGRYLIKSLNRIICEKIILTPELIEKKYKEIQKKTASKDLAQISIDCVRFFSNNENENIKILSFVNRSNSASKYIQFAARIICNDSGTIVIPIILFDCRSNNIKSLLSNNAVDIFKIFTSIKNGPSSSMYLRTIHKLFHHTLQRLITEKTVRNKFRNDLF